MRRVPIAQSRQETAHGGALRMFTVRADSECGNKVCHVLECLPLLYFMRRPQSSRRLSVKQHYFVSRAAASMLLILLLQLLLKTASLRIQSRPRILGKRGRVSACVRRRRFYTQQLTNKNWRTDALELGSGSKIDTRRPSIQLRSQNQRVEASSLRQVLSTHLGARFQLVRPLYTSSNTRRCATTLRLRNPPCVAVLEQTQQSSVTCHHKTRKVA